MTTAPQGRVAGSDTREASSTPTVRASAFAAALGAGPGIAAAFAIPAAWEASAELPMSSLVGPWVTLAALAAGVAAAVVALRRGPEPHGLPMGLGVAATIVAMAALGALADATTAALAMPVVPLLSGWLVGRAAARAASAVVPDVAPAASGIVTICALFGALIAGHIGLVAGGSGLDRAAGWVIGYATVSAIALIRAAQHLPADRARIATRIARAAERAVDDTTAAAAPLALDSISIVFGSNEVLRSATIVVERGEMMALVGANGAGKSTLLRIASGFLQPTSGRVLVLGEDVTSLYPEERVGTGVAFVSGARPVFPDLTVLENLRVAAFGTHVTTRAFASATEAVLELVPALADRAKAKAGVLSGGEQRLLAVAQTLYRRPAVLLADELTLGLNLQARIAVLDLLRLLADQGVAVVSVDHDLVSLLPRCDRAALLTRGGVEMYTEPTTLLDQRSDLLPATFLAGASL